MQDQNNAFALPQPLLTSLLGDFIHYRKAPTDDAFMEFGDHQQLPGFRYGVRDHGRRPSVCHVLLRFASLPDSIQELRYGLWQRAGMDPVLDDTTAHGGSDAAPRSLGLLCR